MNEIEIHAFYDDDARVWTATYDEIGLAVEAETTELLLYKIQELVPQLMELNNVASSSPITINLLSQRKVLAFTA